VAPQDLQARIHALGRRIRALLWIFGVSAVLTIALVAGLALASLDGLLVYRDGGARWLSSLVWWGVVAASAVFFLRPAWRYRPNPVALARRLESRLPEFGGGLSSAVAFLDSPEAGNPHESSQLRAAAVEEAARRASRLPLENVLDWRRAWITAAVAGGAIVLVIVAGVLAGRLAAIGAGRLLAPWSSLKWHHLELVDIPSRAAPGSSLSVRLVDHGRRPPQDAVLWYRLRGEEKARRISFERRSGDYVAVIKSVAGPLSIRATGGDDHDMPWRDIGLIEPPRIESLVLHPPEYANWPSQPVERDFYALAGSRLEARGVAGEPISKAQLEIQHGEQLQRYRLPLAADRLSFHLPPSGDSFWRAGDLAGPEQSVNYSFMITGPGGATVRAPNPPGKITVLPDRPPVVSLESLGPSTVVTRRAVLPLVVSVTDDLAIERVELRYSGVGRSDREAEALILYRGPSTAPPQDPGALRPGLSPRDTRRVVFDWALADIPALEPPAAIDLSAWAYDYRPQAGQPATRRLTILTDEQFDARIAARQADILSLLEEVRQRQQAAHHDTLRVRSALAELSSLSATSAKRLEMAAAGQRQVIEMLEVGAGSAIGKIDLLLAELQLNRYENPAVAGQLEAWRNGLATLIEQHGAPADEALKSIVASQRWRAGESDRGLTTSSAMAGDKRALPAETHPPPHDDPSGLTARLDAVDQRQQAMLRGLEDLLGEYSSWSQFQDLGRRASRLESQQREVLEATRQLEQETLSQNADQLPAELQARLAQQVRAPQAEIAADFDRLLADARRLADRLAERADGAARLSDFLHAAERHQIRPALSGVGPHVENNQLGRAIALQEQAAEGLRELVGVLTGQAIVKPSERLAGLQAALAEVEQAERELKDLTNRQQQLEQRSAADPAANEQIQKQLRRLADQSRQLQQRLERLARRARRLRAERASQALGEASESLEKSADQADSTRLRKLRRRAAEQVKQAAAALRQAISQAQSELAREQLQRIEQELLGLRARQIARLADAERLSELFRSQGELSGAHKKSLQQAALAQSELAEDARRLAAQVEARSAYGLVLRQVVERMAAASEKLNSPPLESAIADQRRAAELLYLLVESLSGEEPSGRQPQDRAGQGEDPQEPTQTISGGEIRLLKLWQQNVKTRTEALDADYAKAGRWNDKLASRRVALAREQEELLSAVARIVSAASGPRAAGDQEPGRGSDRPEKGEPPSKPQPPEKKTDDLPGFDDLPPLTDEG